MATSRIRFMPDDKSAVVRRGTSVLDASRQARVVIRTRCGGNAGCLMCKVRVLDSSGLSAPGEQERRKLGGLIEQQYRLACQAKIGGDCAVEIPEDPLKAAIRAQLQRQNEEEEW